MKTRTIMIIARINSKGSAILHILSIPFFMPEKTTSILSANVIRKNV